MDALSQYMIMILGPLAVFLVGTKGRYRNIGYWVGVASQPFWFVTIIYNEQWPILVAAMIYTYSWGMGLWNHCISPKWCKRKP